MSFSRGVGQSPYSPFYYGFCFMFLNVSGQPQSVLNRSLDYKVIHSNEIVNDKMFPDIKYIKAFKKIKKIDFSKYKSILIRRGHALGDVIMTFPLMNYLKSLGKEVHIHTNTRYAIRGVESVSGEVNFDFYKYDLILNLDGIAELDHIYPKLYKVSRVDIYNKFLNLKNIGNNWRVPYPDVDMDLKGATIGIQVGGSRDFKAIELHPLMKVLDSLGILFYIIDNTSIRYQYKNCVCAPTDVLGLLNIFKRLKGALSFDSGPLWLSHVTNTPVFVVVGPTSGTKVMSRHPNSKSVFYDTKDDFNCKCHKHGCGESAQNCKKQFSCLKNVNQNRLINEFTKWIEGL